MNSRHLYLRLFHGRTSEDDDLEDWGFDGPILGPVGVSWTYGNLKLHAPDDSDFEFLPMNAGHDLVAYDGALYGDFELIGTGDEVLVNLRRAGVRFHDYDTYRKQVRSQKGEDFDQDSAMCEGWFLANGNEIQRDDEAGIFKSDKTAVAHVLHHARLGSGLHKAACRLCNLRF